jgi:hypothetical protein
MVEPKDRYAELAQVLERVRAERAKVDAKSTPKIPKGSGAHAQEAEGRGARVSDKNKVKTDKAILHLGKGATGNKVTPSGLTIRQQMFAQYMAAGYSHADCYRASHITDKMSVKTVGHKAWQLASRDDIRAEVSRLVEEKRRGESDLDYKNKSRFWANIWAEVEGEGTHHKTGDRFKRNTTAGSRVAALRIIGDALHIDEDISDAVKHQTAEQVSNAIMDKLAKLRDMRGSETGQGQPEPVPLVLDQSNEALGD